MIYNIIVDGFWKRPKFQLSAFQGLGFIIFDQCSPMKYRSEGLNPSSSGGNYPNSRPAHNEFMKKVGTGFNGAYYLRSRPK